LAGPLSIDPRDWICPLLVVDADAFNHDGTPEFAAICAVARRHNDISRVLSSTPDRFEPRRWLEQTEQLAFAARFWRVAGKLPRSDSVRRPEGRSVARAALQRLQQFHI
jgi:hypothetical protein